MAEVGELIRLPTHKIYTTQQVLSTHREHNHPPYFYCITLQIGKLSDRQGLAALDNMGHQVGIDPADFA